MVYLFIFAERTEDICPWKIHLHVAYFYTIVVPFSLVAVGAICLAVIFSRKWEYQNTQMETLGYVRNMRFCDILGILWSFNIAAQIAAICKDD